MKRTFLLTLSRAMTDVVDRISTAVASACLVADLLGRVIRPDMQDSITPMAGAAGFFLLALVASWLKAILDKQIAEAKEDRKST
ncbi:hypothetical protein ACGTN6_20910, partial [Halomonas sp. THAF12]|uniref:hypothetical protein n=1 Tax=Halomonas sp. B23F22_10 TaxID=3459515 RepID=UPI00373ED1A3